MTWSLQDVALDLCERAAIVDEGMTDAERHALLGTVEDYAEERVELVHGRRARAARVWLATNDPRWKR